MASALRIALIGAGGRIAVEWRRALAAGNGVRAVALVEADAAARERLSGDDIEVFAKLDELLAARRIDAAIVATPPDTHRDLTARLLEHGAHVLCEKPLAIDVDAATAMLDHAEERHRVLMMASKFRFVDDVESARRRIAAGDIGEPILYENTFCGAVDMRSRWNSSPAVSGGGVLIDNGAHAADLARVLTGPITRVFAVAGPRVQPLEVEDSARIAFETEGHCACVATLSWSVVTGDPAYARIHGSEGSIEIGWRASRIRSIRGGEWQEFGIGYDKVAAFRSQLDHFARAIRGEEAPRPSAQDALDSVLFVSAAQRALREERWVALDEVRPAPRRDG